MLIDPRNFDRFNMILTGVVVPRPIAFVSTISTEGVVNLAPYSFFNAMAYNPPTLIFSSSRRAPGWADKRKDTLANIEETGEYVVNVVVDDIAAAMNATAAEYPADVSEFAVAGLTEAPSEMVRAPRVAESPVNMECRLMQVVNIGEQPHAHGLVIGEIVRMHVRDDILYDGPNGLRINHEALRPTGRLAGNMYCRTDAVYELIRPTYAPPAAAEEPGRSNGAAIKLYGAEWCPDCHRARRYLDSRSVAYEYFDVDGDDAAQGYVKQVNDNRLIIPTIVFPDGSVLAEPSNAQLARQLEG